MSIVCGSGLPSSYRRQFLLGSSALLVFRPSSVALASSPPPTSKKNDLVQKLLERSKANKEKHDRERLESYYKRNYTDYFDFVMRSSRAKQNPSETEKEIAKWLEEHK